MSSSSSTTSSTDNLYTSGTSAASLRNQAAGQPSVDAVLSSYTAGLSTSSDSGTSSSSGSEESYSTDSGSGEYSDVSVSEYTTRTLDPAATAALRAQWQQMDQVATDEALARDMQDDEYTAARTRDWAGIHGNIQASAAVATQLQAEEQQRAAQEAEAHRQQLAAQEAASAAAAAIMDAQQSQQQPAASASSASAVQEPLAPIVPVRGASAGASPATMHRERRGFYSPEPASPASPAVDLDPPVSMVDSSDEGDFVVMRAPPPPPGPDSDGEDGALTVPGRAKTKAELELEAKIAEQREKILDWRYLWFQKHKRPAMFSDIAQSKKAKKLLAKYRSLQRKLLKKRPKQRVH